MVTSLGLWVAGAVVARVIVAVLLAPGAEGLVRGHMIATAVGREVVAELIGHGGEWKAGWLCRRR